MKHNTIYYIIVILILTSCKSARLPGLERNIYFGSGGGFTGKVISYKLSSYGKLSMEMEGGESIPLKVRIKKSALKTIFNLSDSINQSIAHFNMPGNMYYFVSINNKSEIGYIWGESEFKTPEPIERLYSIVSKYTIGR